MRLMLRYFTASDLNLKTLKQTQWVIYKSKQRQLELQFVCVHVSALMVCRDAHYRDFKWTCEKW